MLPLHLFAKPTFSACAAVGLAINATMYGLLFVLSLFFQEGEGWSPLATGLAFLPMMASVTIANIVGGKLAASRGSRLPMALGLACTAAGYLLMAPAIRIGIPYPDLAWRFVLAATGIGLAVPPMTAALLATVERGQSGLAAGVLNTVRQAGGAIGIALFGAAAHGDRLVPGLRLGLFVCAGCLAGATALAVAAVRK
jgi:DHA2 family methylenomycin A resistance protein-like MFS transporter